MKKLISFVLAVIMLIAVVPVAVMAADDSQTFHYDLSSDGKNQVNADPGDIITVVFTLKRSDADEPYTMYAMQNEIKYDSNFFELVEGSAFTADSIETNDIALRDNYREFYMNFVSMTGGVQWDPTVTVGSFQLKVIAQSGTSVVSNEQCQVSLKDGSDSYAVTTQDLTVVVSSDCTVHFETNGGSTIEDQKVQYGEKVKKPEDPTRDGYYLEGWYSDLDLQNKWDFDNDTVTGNMTLYAKWLEGTAPVKSGDVSSFVWIGIAVVAVALIVLIVLLLRKKKTVKFDTDGGSPVNPIKTDKGQVISEPEEPAKPGVTFDGWFTDEGVRWNFEQDKVESNMTLHARWTR